MSDENEIRFALRNLRHLYEQMLVPGRVFDTASAARGLLGPAIEQLEKFDNRMCAGTRLLDEVIAKLEAKPDTTDKNVVISADLLAAISEERDK